MKDRNTLLGIFTIRNQAIRVESICRQLFEFCDAIIAIDESSDDSTRKELLKLERNVPLIIFDSPPLTKEQKDLKLLKAGANALQFFPFRYLLFLDVTSSLPDQSIKQLKEEYRNISSSSTDSHRIFSQNNTGQSFKKKILSKEKVLHLYGKKWKHPQKTEPPKNGVNIFRKILSKLQARFRSTPADNSSGIFKASFHQQNLYLDHPPFRYLMDKYSATSVLDLGCGIGAYLKTFKKWGAKNVLGIDGFDLNNNIALQNSYLKHDLRKPLTLDNQYDLVICVEVAEHIDEKYEHVLLNSIEKHSSNRILFSAAQPNQPGLGHVNCKNLDYWVLKWKELGFEVNVFDSLAVRSLSTFLWFRNNLLVLQRKTSESKIDFLKNRKHLVCNNANMDRWFSQTPSVYDQPLQEGIPDFNPEVPIS